MNFRHTNETWSQSNIHLRVWVRFLHARGHSLTNIQYELVTVYVKDEACQEQKISLTVVHYVHLLTEHGHAKSAVFD